MGWIRDLPKGEGDHGESAVHAYNGGLGWSSQWRHSRVRAHGGGQGVKPLKLKAFCPFSFKKRAQFK